MTIFNDVYPTGSNMVSGITLMSQSVKIMRLTSSNLDIHLETLAVFTTNSGLLNFKNQVDLYYIR
jgi:hypothetical protein